ncbi:MAG: DUF3369 domain-containing protein, partial [Deltaproteobacteria bacterium]|nr:DUF3369 domain-containing protein [Deltaproteobacteria bacterium]
MDNNILVLQDEPELPVPRGEKEEPWLILIADDDQDVHEATLFTLRDSIILGRPLEFFHAYSGRETVEVLRANPGIALVLLDAVMETERAGLSAVRVIREELGLEDLRIILRTGQPGQVPELDTITKYDINDYKTKSELTRTKLITTIVSALRSWQQIQRIQGSRRGLEKIVQASNQFIQEQGLQDFAEGVITQMAGLLDLEPEGIVCVSSGSPPPGKPQPEIRVIAAAGHFRGLIHKNIRELANPAIVEAILHAMLEKKNQLGKNSITVYFDDPSGRGFATWINSPRPLKEVDTDLLEIFCTNISLCASNIELVNRLKEQAWEDPTLKIANLAALLEKIRQLLEMEPAAENTLLVLDIDGFNQINEMLGHEYGDAVLRSLADRLRGLLGPNAFLARISADVFAVVAAPDLLTPELLGRLSSMNVQTSSGERTLSISMGITEVTPGREDASAHLRNGYIALKRAKAEGLGQTVRYSGAIGAETRARIQLL